MPECQLTETSRLQSGHDLLLGYLLQYFFVGGMPGVVREWFKERGINRSIQAVRKAQKNFLAGYEKDIAKHSGRINSLHIFKLFVFDVGILGAMRDLSYKDLGDQRYGISKGYYAENFVACEFAAAGIPLYSWQQRNAKFEFLHVTQEADIIPVEVKSGKRTKAKSLTGYIKRYDPACTIKLVGKVGGTDSIHLVMPLYYAGK